jgi:hypothetical protein
VELIKEITRLVGTLKALLKAYQKMGEMVRKEASAILANDLSALDECQRERETLMVQIRSGERARQEAMIPIGALLGESPGSLTITGLAHIAGGTIGQQLSALADGLRRLMRSITERQRTNHILISHRLDMIRDTLNLLARIHPSTAGYQSSGLMPAQTSRGRIVSGSV